MIIKVRGLTWAKWKSGGDGSACVYEGGKVDPDKIVRVDQNEERNDVKFHADDHQIDRDNSVNSASVALELAKLPDDMLSDVLGYIATENEYQVSDDPAPFVGIGFIHGELYKGQATYRGYWYYKVQCSRGNRSFNTKGEQTAFQTESLEGEAMGVQLTSGGKTLFFEQSKELDTEAAVRTWLNGKAGVSGT